MWLFIFILMHCFCWSNRRDDLRVSLFIRHWLTHFSFLNCASARLGVCRLRAYDSKWKCVTNCPHCPMAFGSFIHLSISQLVALSIEFYADFILFYSVSWLCEEWRIVWVQMSELLLVFTLPNSAKTLGDRLRWEGMWGRSNYKKKKSWCLFPLSFKTLIMHLSDK